MFVVCQYVVFAKPKPELGNLLQPGDELRPAGDITGHRMVAGDVPHDVLGDERFDRLDIA